VIFFWEGANLYLEIYIKRISIIFGKEKEEKKLWLFLVIIGILETVEKLVVSMRLIDSFGI